MSEHMPKWLEQIILASAVIVVIFFIGCIGTLESMYKKDAVVVDISDSTITFEDSTGNIWKSEYDDEYNVGDTVILHIMDNHTSIVRDDVIKKIEKK